jgi:hypothetical protein
MIWSQSALDDGNHLLPQLFLNLDVARIVCLNFRRPTIALYHSGRAHTLVPVIIFGFSKLGPVASPNHDGEYLVWVCRIQI